MVFNIQEPVLDNPDLFSVHTEQTDNFVTQLLQLHGYMFGAVNAQVDERVYCEVSVDGETYAVYAMPIDPVAWVMTYKIVTKIDSTTVIEIVKIDFGVDGGPIIMEPTTQQSLDFLHKLASEGVWKIVGKL